MVIIQHPQEPNDREPGRYGRMVDFGGRSDKGTGYLAHSDRVGQSVLLLHEWFGLQDSFKVLADRLCEEGFTVLAPDLYDGYVASSVEEAEAKMNSLDEAKTQKRLLAAARFLADNWHPRIGVIGFSLGAYLGAWLGQNFPVEATVFYYGLGPIEPSHWNGPLQCHIAGADEMDPVEEVLGWASGLEQGGVDVETFVYEGAGHWFANAAVTSAYNADAAELALERTIGMFRHHLA